MYTDGTALGACDSIRVRNRFRGDIYTMDGLLQIRHVWVEQRAQVHSVLKSSKLVEEGYRERKRKK
jgi:hypothetical protein